MRQQVAQIPVVDLAEALSEQAPPSVLRLVREAAEQVGVLQVVNHGVPADLIADYNARIGRVLDLPRAQKAELASPTGHPQRGWRQWPDDFGRLELERYNVAQFDDQAAARAAGVPDRYLGIYAHANVWPAGDPDMRAVTFRYMQAAAALAQRVLTLHARALGLPGDAFSLGDPPHYRLTTNDYPRWTYPDTGQDEDKLLLLEHADDSVLTVLGQQGDYEGLQVQPAGGDWMPVPIIDGALQAFNGQLLARWTGGALRPARHRVVAGGAVTRRSTAVFCYPSLQTVIEPLPPFAAAAAGQEGYEPVLVFDRVKRRAEDYLDEYGRPDQLAAWAEGRAYVAELSPDSAGR